MKVPPIKNPITRPVNRAALMRNFLFPVFDNFSTIDLLYYLFKTVSDPQELFLMDFVAVLYCLIF